MADDGQRLRAWPSSGGPAPRWPEHNGYAAAAVGVLGRLSADTGRCCSRPAFVVTGGAIMGAFAVRSAARARAH
jgi:hypothetical protein